MQISGPGMRGPEEGGAVTVAGQQEGELCRDGSVSGQQCWLHRPAHVKHGTEPHTRRTAVNFVVFTYDVTMGETG